MSKAPDPAPRPPMKVIAVNGSPRKNWNTATLLNKTLEGARSRGARTEIVHLYDLAYQGCTSCFECKMKGCPKPGRCSMSDGLSPVLERIYACEALVLGSPIYLGNITGAMHSFIERLIFPTTSYNLGPSSLFQGRIASAFIYTMNAPKSYAARQRYPAMFRINRHYLEHLNAKSLVLPSYDSHQFSEQAKYEVPQRAEGGKPAEGHFEEDCAKAFAMGADLAARRGPAIS